MKNYNTMLHMKLNSAVSVLAVAAAFAVFLPPSNASAGICFLPDCQDDEIVQGDINMNINSDTEYCEEKGYTYYSSGECPQYQAVIGTCSRDDHYLKCDAVTWCKNNGYNTQTCSLPSFVNDQCPNGKPYYKGCKEDRPRACREQGYVNSCSPGRLYKSTNRCPWDSSYGKCCTASPSTGCPSNYKVTCDSSRGSSGRDTCGYTCYRCCNDTCPSGTSKNYSGSISSYTECGTACRRCKDCTTGSRSYTGAYAGTSECGTCYKCNDTCSSGSKSSSCGSGYESYRSGSTECGSACYSCRKHTHSYSCPSGYQSSSCGSGYTTSSTRSKSCSCGATYGTCYKCSKNTNTGNNNNNNYTGGGNTGNNNNNNNNTNTGTTTPAVDPDACKSTYIIGVSYAGWCDWCDKEGGPKCIWCKRERRCTTNSGKDKWLNDGYYIAKSGYDGEVNCQAALAGGGKNCDEGTIYPE